MRSVCTCSPAQWEIPRHCCCKQCHSSFSPPCSFDSSPAARHIWVNCNCKSYHEINPHISELMFSSFHTLIIRERQWIHGTVVTYLGIDVQVQFSWILQTWVAKESLSWGPDCGELWESKGPCLCLGCWKPFPSPGTFPGQRPRCRRDREVGDSSSRRGNPGPSPRQSISFWENQGRQTVWKQASNIIVKSIVPEADTPGQEWCWSSWQPSSCPSPAGWVPVAPVLPWWQEEDFFNLQMWSWGRLTISFHRICWLASLQFDNILPVIDFSVNTDKIQTTYITFFYPMQVL